MATSPPPTPPPPTGRKVYKVVGRFLTDPSGDTVVARGVEQNITRVSWIPDDVVAQVGLSGANTVRVLPSYREDNPNTIAQIERAIRDGINGHMLVDVAIDGGHNPDVYLDPAIRTLLLKYEPWIVVHAMGESQADDDATWSAEGRKVVAKLRAGGYKCPLYLMGRTYGRHLPGILAKGQEVIDADPEHNVVFGWQAYWGQSGGGKAAEMKGHYQNEYGMSLQRGLELAAAAKFPIQVGIMEHSDPSLDMAELVPYSEIMKLCHELRLGTLWWDWREGPDDLTPSGRNGDWWHRGREVVTDNVSSISKTAVRTAYQKAQKAP